MELRKLALWLRIFAICLAFGRPSAVRGQEDAAVILNAYSRAYRNGLTPSPEARTCVLLQEDVNRQLGEKRPDGTMKTDEVPDCDEKHPYRFFVQGRQSEFRVYNRKFFTDYQLTIDTAIALQSTPMIRGLDEAATLAISPPSLTTTPVAKGNIQTINARLTRDVLLELLDETTAMNARTELVAEAQEIDRDDARIRAEFRSFDETFSLLMRGRRGAINCNSLAGAPNLWSAEQCLKAEIDVDSNGQWVNPPFDGEQTFREVNVRVQDDVAAISNLSTMIQNTDLQTPLQTLTSDVTQFEVNLNTYKGNYQATADAIEIAKFLLAKPGNDKFRRDLRPEQMRALLAPKLKTDKPADDAILNQILEDYLKIISSEPAVKNLRDRLDAMEAEIKQSDPNYRYSVGKDKELQRARSQANVELPAAINKTNALQSQLLNRINFIYDHSEVREPLIHAIDLSSYSGNVIAYYTVRRIESFTRYTITPILLPPSTQNAQSPVAAAPMGLPAAAPTTAAATTAPSTTATAPATPPATPPGIVVANGRFDVHERDRGTVIAAVAVSTLKDQNVGQMVPATINPALCPNATPPVAPATNYTDPNCFAPINNGTSIQVHGIAGVGFYFRPRDTFPHRFGTKHDPREYFGVMGALAVDQVNSYFVGPFWEPFLGLQVSGGANFGNVASLNPVYTFNTPVDLNGSFTTNKQKIGGFFGIGLDLGIFKKIFGQVTGIGQQIGTVGQPPTSTTLTPP